MKKKFIKNTATAIFALCFPLISWCQTSANDATVNTTVNSTNDFMEINSLLAMIAGILIIPLYVTSKSFLFSIKHHLNLIKKDGVILLGLLLFSQLLHAQNAVAPIAAPESYISTIMTTYILLGIIFFEVVMIAIFSWMTSRFIKPAKSTVESSESAPAQQSWFAQQWAKMNNFRSLEEEKDIDTGHSYDGIRELDNITPPWFVFAFYMSIVFAIVYMYRNHVSHSAPLQIEEFNIEMAQAEEEKAKFLATQSNNVDETTVKLLDDAGIAKGKAIFVEKCAACHAANAASTPGGVGPNLTDNYWIHGGNISDIFKSVKYGWPEKGMISWKDQLTPNQIAEISSFIFSAKGSVTAGGKEPQGDEFKAEVPAVEAKVDSTIVDSVK